MSFPESPHLAVGTGRVGIITLWTKKEHVMNHVPADLYAVCAQLYSRDEGISALLRSLLANPSITDLIVCGVDLNRCAETLFALWENGAKNGQVIGAPGYVDTEIPENVIDEIRENVTLHDKRSDKDYAALAEYIKQLPEKQPWATPREFALRTITPPDSFPNAPQVAIQYDSIEKASIELAHMLGRFGKLRNVQVCLAAKGTLPAVLADAENSYTENLIENDPGTYGEHLHRNNRLGKLVQSLTKKTEAVVTFGDDVEDPLLDLLEVHRDADGLHLFVHAKKSTLSELPLLAAGCFSLLDLIAGELDEPAGTLTVSTSVLAPSRIDATLREKPHVLRRQGDPRSNLLIRIRDGRIWVTHLSPDGKRLEEFSGETARELYKRLVVEHRITDLSHAAYAGYELARAEAALQIGGMYEQDS